MTSTSSRSTLYTCGAPHMRATSSRESMASSATSTRGEWPAAKYTIPRPRGPHRWRPVQPAHAVSGLQQSTPSPDRGARNHSPPPRPPREADRVKPHAPHRPGAPRTHQPARTSLEAACTRAPFQKTTCRSTWRRKQPGESRKHHAPCIGGSPRSDSTDTASKEQSVPQPRGRPQRRSRGQASRRSGLPRSRSAVAERHNLANELVTRYDRGFAVGALTSLPAGVPEERGSGGVSKSLLTWLSSNNGPKHLASHTPTRSTRTSISPADGVGTGTVSKR